MLRKETWFYRVWFSIKVFNKGRNLSEAANQQARMNIIRCNKSNTRIITICRDYAIFAG